jgi:hypothetical protein
LKCELYQKAIRQISACEREATQDRPTCRKRSDRARVAESYPIAQVREEHLLPLPLGIRIIGCRLNRRKKAILRWAIGRATGPTDPSVEMPIAGRDGYGLGHALWVRYLRL